MITRLRPRLRNGNGNKAISHARDRTFLPADDETIGRSKRAVMVGAPAAGLDRILPPGYELSTLPADDRALAGVTGIGFVVFDLASLGPDVPLDRICFDLHRRGILTIGVCGADARKAACAQLCHYELRGGTPPVLFDNIESRCLGELAGIDLAALAEAAAKRRRPSVTLICEKSLVSASDLAELSAAGLAVDVDALAKADRVDAWAAAVGSARGEIVVLLASADRGRSAADLVRTCVFEHWYPDVDFCCERAAGIDRWDLDLRRFSCRRDRARAEVAEALSASADLPSAGRALLGRIAARGGSVTTIDRLEPDDVVTAPPAHALTRGLSWLQHRLEPWRPQILQRGRTRRLRVLTYRWHVAHQYEIMRLPADFTLACGFGVQITEFWGYEQRPFPSNVSFRQRSQIDPRDYDVALVHFDENALCPHLSNGVLTNGWGAPFRWLLSIDSLPKIAICHGTPPFAGQYAADPNRKTSFEILEDERAKLVAALDDSGAVVVCNSFQAQREWNFARSRVIWHGFDPAEFSNGSHSRGVLTSPEDYQRPHYRGLFEQQDVLRELAPDIDVTRHLRQVPLERRGTNGYARRQFRSYVEQIGAFTFYLNTTLRSPMPRSRGEAMMTGVVPVSLDNHDVGMFVDNGHDGFVAGDPSALAAFINEAGHDTAATSAMCAAARRKAIDVFHIDRFLSDWRDMLSDAVGFWPPR